MSYADLSRRASAVVAGDSGASHLSVTGMKGKILKSVHALQHQQNNSFLWSITGAATQASALARNDHTLLARSDPAPRIGESRFATSKRGSCCGHAMCEPALPAPVRLFVLVGTGMSSRAMSTLHAFGADDGTPNRTPSAWMISAACSLALRQIVFFVWVTLSEHKWVILAERRGPGKLKITVTCPFIGSLCVSYNFL